MLFRIFSWEGFSFSKAFVTTAVIVFFSFLPTNPIVERILLTLCLVCFNLSNIPAISKKGEEDERGTIIDRETLSNIKTRLQNMENALGQSRTDLQTVKDGANQQVVALTQTHAEEKGSLTTKIDFHAQKIADLESQLAESGKSSKSK